MQVVRLKFFKKSIKLIKITNCVCVCVTVVVLLWCALGVCNRHLCAFVVGIKNNLKMHGTTNKVICVKSVLLNCDKFYTIFTEVLSKINFVVLVQVG